MCARSFRSDANNRCLHGLGAKTLFITSTMVLPMWAMVPGSRHVTNMDLSRACCLSFEGLAVGLCCRARHRTLLCNINCAPSADGAERIGHLMVHIRKGFKNTGPRTMRSLPLTFNRYNVMPCIFKTISCDAPQLHGTSLRFPIRIMPCHVTSCYVTSGPVQPRPVTLSQLKPNGPVSWQTRLVAPTCVLRHLAHLLSLSLSLVLPILVRVRLYRTLKR